MRFQRFQEFRNFSFLKFQIYQFRVVHGCRVKCRPDVVIREGIFFENREIADIMRVGIAEAPKMPIQVGTSLSTLKNLADSLPNKAQTLESHSESQIPILFGESVLFRIVNLAG